MMQLMGGILGFWCLYALIAIITKHKTSIVISPILGFAAGLGAYLVKGDYNTLVSSMIAIPLILIIIPLQIKSDAKEIWKLTHGKNKNQRYTPKSSEEISKTTSNHNYIQTQEKTQQPITQMSIAENRNTKSIRQMAEEDNDFDRACNLIKYPNTLEEEQGIGILNRLAERDHADSQNMLAEYLFSNNKDQNKAFDLWKRAAAQNHQEAKRNLRIHKGNELLDALDPEQKGLPLQVRDFEEKQAIINDRSINRDLKTRFEKMFNQSFDDLISRELMMIGNTPCFYYVMFPCTEIIVGQIRAIVETLDNPKRFIVGEYSYDISIVLCEWVFDNETRVQHWNYGPVATGIQEMIDFTRLFKKKVEEILAIKV